MTAHNFAPTSRCYNHQVAIHSARMSVDDVLSGRLVRRPLEAAGTLRLLQSHRNKAFVFDDHDDSLIVVALSTRITPQVCARFWMAGARLETAGVSSEQRVLFGWDNRNQNIIAFDMMVGQVVGTIKCEADYVAI
ncbi:hypothetical protein [Gluconobacter wancherniae]|uniref:hypothetical protein n=2 Tax=Gluconobacter wancherniae TaxID=1307955 RepID=UPI001B8BA0E7|nr:hypothetical protein [Gluconobacter wancherniae]